MPSASPPEAPVPEADAPGQATIRVIAYPHTHWDREWWGTYQEFRFKLVSTVDALLDELERDPAFTSFAFDGQNILLRDYLEVRPENARRLADLVRAGRIQIGPWYVLADQLLTSGEAWIRNLWMGEKAARALGVANSRIGYLPDQFGHPGQLPQVLAGFGIDAAVVWRGFGGPPSEVKSEFWWEAPDGTRVLAHYLAAGYDRSRYTREQTGEERARHVRQIVDLLRPYSTGAVLLQPYGGDHLPAQADLPRWVLEVGESVRAAGIDYRIGSLANYFAALRAEGEPAVTWRGEGRRAGGAFLLPGVHSARLNLKRANALAQVALERYAEPFQALDWIMGGAYEQAFLWLAWDLLLQNHPHDSICGCSTDQVHREMLPRFAQSRQIAELLTEAAARDLTRRIEGGADGAQMVTVFNPLAFARTDTATVYMDPELGLEPRGWTLRDAAGAEVPFQARPWTGVRQAAQRADWTEVVFVARQVPGVGYRTFRFEPRPVHARRHGPRHGARPRLQLGTGVLENAHLRVEVSPVDGSLTVTDFASGLRWERLNSFRDGGDAGDTYNHSAPRRDRLFTTDRVPPKLAWMDTGPARATLRVTWEWALPEGLTGDRLSRSPRMTPFVLHSDVSLSAGSRRIDINTHFQNTARDHRLQALFPLGAPATCSSAESAFEVCRRSTELARRGKDGPEAPVPEHPQQSFVSLSAGGRGLTIANRGLPEFSASPSGVVALTVVRAVGHLSRDDLSQRSGAAGPCLPVPEAQMPGEVTAEYSIIPHAGSWAEASSHRQAHAFSAPFWACPHRDQSPPARAVPPAPAERTLPGDGALLHVDGPVELTALKRAEDFEALIVRLLNESDTRASARLRPLRRPLRAWSADLREQPLPGGSLEIAEDGSVEVEVAPWRLATIAFEFWPRVGPGVPETGC